jgi:hypothetical protein
MRSERRPIGIPNSKAVSAFQHVDVEEQLPAANDDAVDDGHPQEETRIAVECAHRLDIVNINVAKHRVIIGC